MPLNIYRRYSMGVEVFIRMDSKIIERFYLGACYDGGFIEIQREDGTSMSGDTREEVMNAADIAEAKEAYNHNGEVYLVKETIVAERI
jgi:hypothetical protein